MRFVNLLNSVTEPALIIFFSLWFAIAFTGCTHVPDVPVCVEITNVKGWCTNTVSDEEFFVDEEHPHVFSDGKMHTWWEIRPYMVLLPTKSWAELKSYVIKNCKRSNCDKYIQSWDRKINELDGMVPK